MIKSRTAQLIYQSFFCALGVVAFFGSIGFYNMNVTGDFFIYFTNLSNYLCIGVMLAELVQTAKKKADSYVAAVPHLHFISMLGIVLTFAVFNILLAHAPGRDPALTADLRENTFPPDHSISVFRICDVSAGRHRYKAAPGQNARPVILYASGRSSAWKSARKRFLQSEVCRC
jgi:hypothetical protein